MRWLDEQRSSPVRLIVAPPGWGKTTLLAAYAAHEPRAVYYRVNPGLEPVALYLGIAAACGVEPAPPQVTALLAALESRLPLVLLLDDVHLAAPAARAEIATLASTAPPGLDVVVASCSRTAVDADRWVAEGYAALCGPDLLAFDERETAQLALRLGLQASELGVARLLRHSDGWPIVLAGALRAAGVMGRRIESAYEAWSTRDGLTFTDFILREMERAGPWAQHDLERLLAAPGAESRDDYAGRLEAEGLFVRRVGGVYRLHAPVATALAPSVAVSPSAGEGGALPALHLRMFGSFEARIGAREVPWIRRGDQHLVQYLALRPNGSATRSEVMEAFWPGADAEAASQRLRTACSNVRKALAAVAGAGNVERYFCSRGDLAIRTHNVVADVRRFRAHVRDGDREFETGNMENALTHYRSAEALYRGDLLVDDPGAAWLAARAENLRALFAHVLERSIEIWQERGEPALARRYAARLEESRRAAPGARRTPSRDVICS